MFSLLHPKCAVNDDYTFFYFMDDHPCLNVCFCSGFDDPTLFALFAEDLKYLTHGNGPFPFSLSLIIEFHQLKK